MSWLDELKEGDMVIVEDSRCKNLGTVVKASLKSQVIVKSGSYEGKYWKKNGDAVGSGNSWYCHRILEGTPDAIAKVREMELKHKLKAEVTELWNKKLNKLNSTQLQNLIDQLNDY